MSKKPKLTKPQQLALDVEWKRLEDALESKMHELHPTRVAVGCVLYQMKMFLKKWGLSKGRRGRWDALLRKHKLDRSSVRNWICLYQEEHKIPPDQWVFQPNKPKIPQQNGQNNTLDFSVLNSLAQCETEVEVADENGKHTKDHSPEQRMAVECVFCLTLEEKRRFMEAVARLGSLEATQRIYRSLVSL
jgi:hypothetical protein